jgi:hypothetical protein
VTAAELARHLRAGATAAGLRWQDTGYVVVVGTPVPPGGIILDAGYLDTVLAALADAGYLRRSTGAWCADCEDGMCPDHLADCGTADRYDGLAARLRREVAR